MVCTFGGIANETGMFGAVVINVRILVENKVVHVEDPIVCTWTV